MPLHVEILYNEYNFSAAFAVASVLALLALVTLGLKLLAERHMSAELSSARDVPAFAGPIGPSSGSSSALSPHPSPRASTSLNATHAPQQHPLKQGEL